ncbi:MAG: very short patch repair endonuclease [Bacilli bacterium]|jgi:DNA mismatch endonuclease (patch repair protein)
MVDSVDKETRSRMMAAVRSRGNLTTDLKMARLLKEYGFSGWRRNVRLIGTPDFCWRKQRIALFVDGCFWHGCPKCYRQPKSNVIYWKKKIERNKRRDKEVNRNLTRIGWKVVRIWECQIESQQTVNRIKKELIGVLPRV